MLIGERLHRLRKSLNLSQKDFGEVLGISQKHISQIENNTREPSEQLIKHACLRFNTTENWLKLGEGEMFISPEEFLKNQKAHFDEQAFLDACKLMLTVSCPKPNEHDAAEPQNDSSCVCDNPKPSPYVSGTGKLRDCFNDLMRDNAGDMIISVPAWPDQDYTQIIDYLADTWKEGDQRKRDWLIVQFEKAFPDARKVAVTQEAEHPELARIIKYLTNIWDSDDQRLKNWACVQFEEAFPDMVAQKKQKETPGQATA